MSYNETLRESVLDAKIAMICQAAIGITFLTSVATMEFISLREKLPKLRFRYRRSDRTILWLIGVALFALAFFLVSLTMYAVDWTNNAQGCFITGAPFIPLLFVITKQFLYFFLYERSCVIHDSLKLNGKLFVSFRIFVAICIIIGIP